MPKRSAPSSSPPTPPGDGHSSPPAYPQDHSPTLKKLKTAAPSHTSQCEPDSKPKPKSKSYTATTTTSKAKSESPNSGPWTTERRRIVTELILEAGYSSLDFDHLSECTGLTKQQLRDGLKIRKGKTNLQMQLIKFASASTT
ncbi:hypothetical protein IAR55_000927 [Kwoniella newhampshirensis]|uniref:Uncharacterized protein n=1 Tax=Kwoniella newhampshirensis TaxID=1651941 RepID=A0AAW0Z481_9TREE